MVAIVADVSSDIDAGVLCGMLALGNELYFVDSGCSVDSAPPQSGFVGLGPYDSVDLLLGKNLSIRQAAVEILNWAKYWAEERNLKPRSRR